MRVCIFGAGAMGTSLGAALSKAGVPVELVSRNAAHVEALRTRGAVLTGSVEMTVSVTAMLPEEMAGKYDIIFLAIRQRGNREAAQGLVSFLKEDGALVSVQNGLPERALSEVFGADRVYGCALSWGAERIAPGEIQMTGGSFAFSLGAFGAGKKCSEIAALLKRAGDVTVGDLQELRYAKLAVNAAFSTLSVISGLTFGELASRHKRLALGLMREVFCVARAAGCRKLPLRGHDLFRVFSGPWAGLLLPVAMKPYKETRSGMLKDLEAGRRTDIDYVAGAAVLEGGRLGVETPLLEGAVSMVHDIENGLAEIAPETLQLL